MAASQVRAFLGSWGIDIRLLCVASVSFVTVIWSASNRYSALEAHLDQLDRGQTQLQQSIVHQDELWNASLKQQVSALTNSLTSLSDNASKERAILGQRLGTLEAWRDEEQKRDTEREMAIARLSEQVTSVNSNISDIKSMIETLMVRAVSKQMFSAGAGR